MKIKKKIKEIRDLLKKVLDSIKNLLSGQKQQMLLENAHYETLLQHLDNIEKQAGSSILRIESQMDRLRDDNNAANENAAVVNTEESIIALSESLKAQQVTLVEQLSSLRDELNSSPAKEALPASIVDKIQTLSTSVNKHDVVIEDLLESLEDAHSQQKKAISKIEALMNDEKKAEISELKADKKALLSLFEAYQDQVFMLSHAAENDENWSYQFGLVNQKLSSVLQASGISLINDLNVPVNYELHEIIDIQDTHDETLDECVASVYTCGYTYKGLIQKKARVSAYRYAGPGEDDDLDDDDLDDDDLIDEPDDDDLPEEDDDMTEDTGSGEENRESSSWNILSGWNR